LFRDTSAFDLAARITRPSQVMVEGTIRTVSSAGEPAGPLVRHGDAVIRSQRKALASEARADA